MAKRTWNITLDDVKHTIELDHGTMSGKRRIWIDGQPLLQLMDFGRQHPFVLAGYNCVVFIYLP